MTDEQWRELLTERFGPLREVERERKIPPARVIACRRRRLAEAMSGEEEAV